MKTENNDQVGTYWRPCLFECWLYVQSLCDDFDFVDEHNIKEEKNLTRIFLIFA